MIFTIGRDEHGEFIRCLHCGLKSYNPNDVAQRYCGNCHIFHGIDQEAGMMKPELTPQGWLDIHGVGRIDKPPNRWRRFWAWALLGWSWERPR